MAKATTCDSLGCSEPVPISAPKGRQPPGSCLRIFPHPADRERSPRSARWGVASRVITWELIPQAYGLMPPSICNTFRGYRHFRACIASPRGTGVPGYCMSWLSPL